MAIHTTRAGKQEKNPNTENAVSDTVVVCRMKQFTVESVREEEGEQDGEGMEGEGHEYTQSV